MTGGEVAGGERGKTCTRQIMQAGQGGAWLSCIAQPNVGHMHAAR